MRGGGTPFLPLCAHFAGPGEGEPRLVLLVAVALAEPETYQNVVFPLPLALIRMDGFTDAYDSGLALADVTTTTAMTKKHTDGDEDEDDENFWQWQLNRYSKQQCNSQQQGHGPSRRFKSPV